MRLRHRLGLLRRLTSPRGKFQVGIGIRRWRKRNTGNFFYSVTPTLTFAQGVILRTGRHWVDHPMNTERRIAKQAESRMGHAVASRRYFSWHRLGLLRRLRHRLGLLRRLRHRLGLLRRLRHRLGLLRRLRHRLGLLRRLRHRLGLLRRLRHRLGLLRRLRHKWFESFCFAMI
jgi:hypothetical protein